MKTELILGAMMTEIQKLLSSEKFESINLSQYPYPLWALRTNEKIVYLSECGIGPVNSAFRVGKLTSLLMIDRVIFIGLGGSICSDLQLGDFVIGENIIQHDALCILENSIELMACGKPHLSLSLEKRSSPIMRTNSTLINSICEYLNRNQLNYKVGTILSGSSFVGSKKLKEDLAKLVPNGLLVDMESCSIAFVCQELGIEYLVVKEVADTLNPYTKEEYLEYLNKKTANYSIILNWVKNI